MTPNIVKKKPSTTATATVATRASLISHTHYSPTGFPIPNVAIFIPEGIAGSRHSSVHKSVPHVSMVCRSTGGRPGRGVTHIPVRRVGVRRQYTGA